MRNTFIGLGLVAILAQGSVAQQFADMAVAPPPASKAALDSELNPLPKASVAKYLERVGQANTYA
ncbi:MAG: hypothetical protein WC655_27940, partial [Candidatus Hydrogenedentales bacterium]